MAGKKTPVKILLAPLDWGLGHATRSTPLIQALLDLGVEVHLAGNGPSLAYLRQEFPRLPYLELPGYNVVYSRWRSQVGALLRQFRRLGRVIQAEHAAVGRYAAEQGIDATLSDHRYGVWLAGKPSVLIGHQLSLQIPVAMGWARSLVDRLHLRYLRPFEEIWVPDYAPPDGLAGKLVSHFRLRAPDAYLGPLSRFQGYPRHAPEPQARPLALLSGPEPQRTLLEERLIRQAKAENIALTLVQGRPDLPYEERLEGPVHLISFMKGEALARRVQSAPQLISRAGYSSLMDFACLGTGGLLLVPTPGQTEQEYLARELARQGKAHTVPQHRLKLGRDLKQAAQNRGFEGEGMHTRPFVAVLENWIAQRWK